MSLPDHYSNSFVSMSITVCMSTYLCMCIYRYESYDNSTFNFLKNSVLYSIGLVSFFIWTNRVKGFQTMSLTHAISTYVLAFASLTKCVVMSHCSSDLHFSGNERCLFKSFLLICANNKVS